MIWPHPIQAALFDVDGTILDSISLFDKATEEMVGKPYPPELAARYNGRPELEFVAGVIDYFKLQLTPEEFVEKRHKILEKSFRSVKLIHGVERIIRKLHDLGIPMATATSSTRGPHEMKIASHQDLFSLFAASICQDDVKEAKPSPVIFETASKKLGDFKPENVLVFEDASNGVKAANAAGMPVIMLSSSENDLIALEHVGATPTCRIASYDDFNFEAFTWKGKSFE